MVCHEGFYVTYNYVIDNRFETMIFKTALDIIEKYINIWLENSSLIKVESINEFVKIEKLQELYPEAEVLHV